MKTNPARAAKIKMKATFTKNEIRVGDQTIDYRDITGFRPIKDNPAKDDYDAPSTRILAGPQQIEIDNSFRSVMAWFNSPR